MNKNINQDVEILEKLFDKYYHKDLNLETILKETNWSETYFYKVYNELEEKRLQEIWENEQRALT